MAEEEEKKKKEKRKQEMKKKKRQKRDEMADFAKDKKIFYLFFLLTIHAKRERILFLVLSLSLSLSLSFLLTIQKYFITILVFLFFGIFSRKKIGGKKSLFGKVVHENWE